MIDTSDEVRWTILDAFLDEYTESGDGIISAGFDGPVLVVALGEGANVDVPRGFHGFDVRVERHGWEAQTFPLLLLDGPSVVLDVDS